MLGHKSWILSSAILADVYLQSVHADCYSRDGILARESAVYNGPELLPCGNSTNNCCLEGEKCGTNLLCVSNPSSTGGAIYTRQYCSDKNWANCSQLSPETISHGVQISQCKNNVFCIGRLNDCCQDGPTYFVHPRTGEVKKESEADSTESPSYWTINSASILAPSSATSPQATNSISSESPTSTSTSSPLPSPHLSTGASAGIGVGCGVVVIVGGILGWLLIRERKKRRQSQKESEHTKIMLLQHQASSVVKNNHVQTSHTELHADHETRHELDDGQIRAEMY